MTLPWTILWLVVSGLLAGVAMWRDRNPHELGEAPPLVPSWLLLGLGMIGIVVALAHLVSIWTGHPLQGRYAPW